jgi:hypothetical protein
MLSRWVGLQRALSAGAARPTALSAARTTLLGATSTGALGGVRSLITGDTPELRAWIKPALDPATGRYMALNRMRPAPGSRKHVWMRALPSISPSLRLPSRP